MTAEIIPFPSATPAPVTVSVYLLCDECRRRQIVRVPVFEPTLKTMESAAEEAQTKAAAMARAGSWRRCPDRSTGMLCGRCHPIDDGPAAA